MTEDFALTVEERKKVVFLISGGCESTGVLGSWEPSKLGILILVNP